MVSYQWPQELVEFKQIEYDISQTYWKEVYTKCNIPLSSIAYAFAVKESGNGNWHKQANKNNLFWLRYGKSTTKARPMFAQYDVKSYTTNGYNVYNTRYDAIYDFMNQYYTRGCSLSKTYVRGHLNGSNGGRGWVDDYYGFIQKYSKSFSNRANANVSMRVLTKPKSAIEFYDTTKTLKENWYSHKDYLEYLYVTWSTIIVDSRTSTYSVRYPIVRLPL